MPTAGFLFGGFFLKARTVNTSLFSPMGSSANLEASRKQREVTIRQRNKLLIIHKYFRTSFFLAFSLIYNNKNV